MVSTVAQPVSCTGPKRRDGGREEERGQRRAGTMRARRAGRICHWDHGCRAAPPAAGLRCSRALPLSISASSSASLKLILLFRIVNLLLSDADFAKLVAGKANAQKLFMSGKLRVRGDVMKATKMEPILKKAQMGAKL